MVIIVFHPVIDMMFDMLQIDIFDYITLPDGYTQRPAPKYLIPALPKGNTS